MLYSEITLPFLYKLHIIAKQCSQLHMFVRTSQHFEVNRYARCESISIPDNVQIQHTNSLNKEIIVLYK